MSSIPATNPTIFLRLKASASAPREIAWADFHGRYAPIIAAFARRLGARPQDVDDVVQDVLLGFFATSPTFAYDPARGRFRGYLKACTCHALSKRLGAQLRSTGESIENLDSETLAIEQAWNDVWEQEQVRRALEHLRTEIGQTKTFQAFEAYVLFDRPAQIVADELKIHLNSVYRAKEQVTRLLQERVLELKDDD